MSERFRGLEWLQRRRDGESVDQIAARAGVTPETVRYATDPYGPFPGTAAYLRLVETPGWVQMRRDGVSITEIARNAGVSRQLVSAATQPHGPYPSPRRPTPNRVAQWVAARRTGRAVRAIAKEAGVSARTVTAVTKPYGPFRVARRRLPPGMLGVTAVAELLGVTDPTVAAWARRGYLPVPDFVTARGRRVWLVSTIEAWLPGAGLAECQSCGARVRQLAIHHARRHPESVAGEEGCQSGGGEMVGGSRRPC